MVMALHKSIKMQYRFSFWRWFITLEIKEMKQTLGKGYPCIAKTL